MRVVWCLLTLLVLSLAAVPVQADAGHDATAACPATPEDVTNDRFEILTLDHAYVGHPIPVAIAATMPQAAHTTYDLRVFLDGRLILDVPNIHEHDALHTTTFTPGVGEQVRIKVTERVGGEPGKTAIRHVPLCAAHLPDAPLSRTAAHETQIKDGTITLALAGIQDQEPALTLVDVRDTTGRLTLSAWAAPFPHATIGYDTARFPGALDTYYLPAPAEDLTLWGRHGDLAWDADPTDDLPINGGMLPDGEGGVPGSCAGDLRLVTDPDPALAQSGMLERPTWHADSDLRFAVLRDLAKADGLEPIEYRITQQSANTAGLPWTQVRAHDPFGLVTFQIPEPGTYHLAVREGGADRLTCLLFDVIPNNADGGPGTVHADLDVNGTGIDLTFTAERQGTKLGHYEFDTRVYRLETAERPGALVWMGKLHGHAGVASAELAGLAPGDYVVTTFPSPQNLGTPAVVTDDPAGFRWTFHIPEPDTEPNAEERDPIPAPGVVAVLLLGALVGLLRRRSLTQ